MCPEKNDTTQESNNSCCSGMETMIKNFCNSSGETTDSCSQLKGKCSTDTDHRSNCMAMFQQMRDRKCGQAKDTGKSPGCCD